MTDFQNKRPKKPGGILGYLRATKRYWLIPLLVAALIVAILVGLGSTVLAPFLYPLF